MKMYVSSFPMVLVLVILPGASARADDARPLNQTANGEGAAPAEGSLANPATRPRGRPTNAWRYEFYNGRWWYWSPDRRWSFYSDSGRRWTTLPAQSTEPSVAGAGRPAAGARNLRGRSTAPSRRSGLGGLSTYGGNGFYDPFGTGSWTTWGGEADSSASPGLYGGMGSSAGALSDSSPLGLSTLPSRTWGKSRVGNRGVGTGGGGLGVSGAGGSLSGGAGGSLGGGAGGSQFGPSDVGSR